MEIKRRKRKFFEVVPEYERVQLEAYLHLYDCDRGAHVESFGESDRVRWFQRDATLWDCVVADAIAAVRSGLSNYAYSSSNLQPSKSARSVGP